MSRPLPVVGITGVLPTHLRDVGTDPAITSLIVGEGPSNHAGLYYTAISLQRIKDAYETALRERLQIDAPFAGPPVDDADQIIGTEIRPVKRKIQIIFAHYLEALKGFRTETVEERMAFHNHYALYTYMLLCLATGHRPGTAPFGRITDFDLHAGFVWICDSEVRRGDAGRLVPLPGQAVGQVRHYLDHLAAMVRSKRPGRRLPIINEVEARVSGEASLLFFIEDRDVVALSPANLSQRLETVWPLPLNWHRHYLRTTLSARLRPELLDAFMGHADFGQEPLNATSCLDIQSLKTIAREIECILEDLGAEPCEGLPM